MCRLSSGSALRFGFFCTALAAGAVCGSPFSVLDEITEKVWERVPSIHQLPVKQLMVSPFALDVQYDLYSLQGLLNFDFMQESSGWKFGLGFSTQSSTVQLRSNREDAQEIHFFAHLAVGFEDVRHWVGRLHPDPISWLDLSLEVVGDLFPDGDWQTGIVAEVADLNLRDISKGLDVSVAQVGGLIVADRQGWRQTTGSVSVASLVYEDWHTSDFTLSWGLKPDSGTLEMSSTTVRDFAETLVLDLRSFNVQMDNGLWQVNGSGHLAFSGAFAEQGDFWMSGSVHTIGPIPELKRVENMLFHFQGGTGELTAGPVSWRPGRALSIPITLKSIDVAQWMAVLPPQQFALNGFFNGHAMLSLDQGRVQIQSAVLELDPRIQSRFLVTDEQLLREWVGMIGGPPAMRGQILEAMAGGIQLSRSKILLERLPNETVSVRLELSGEARGRTLIVPVGGKTITNNFEGDSFARLLELWGLGWLH